MKVSATVVYPIMVSIEVDDNAGCDEIREKLKVEADNQFETSSIKSVITECSESECCE